MGDRGFFLLRSAKEATEANSENFGKFSYILFRIK